jgi:hypothetical protein
MDEGAEREIRAGGMLCMEDSLYVVGNLEEELWWGDGDLPDISLSMVRDEVREGLLETMGFGGPVTRFSHKSLIVVVAERGLG